MSNQNESRNSARSGGFSIFQNRPQREDIPGENLIEFDRFDEYSPVLFDLADINNTQAINTKPVNQNIEGLNKF